MDTKKIEILSEPTEFKLRDKSIIVYPITLETLLDISPKITELEKPDSSIAKQVKCMVDIIYEIIRSDNSIKKEELQKILTIKAGIKIIQEAIGTDVNLNNVK